MVIKQRGALISLLHQSVCQRHARPGQREDEGDRRVAVWVTAKKKMVHTILGDATTLFWGIIKSAFVLDKSLTPL